MEERNAALGPEQDSQPRSRSDASLVYDVSRGVTILFGGNGSDSATWEYDGASWSQTMLEDPEGDGHPTARYGASFVYDSWRNVSVLFGGNQMTNETWEYDSQSWSKTIPESTLGSPSARGGHMAFDAHRGCNGLFWGVY